jgi:hypothetical protein
MPVVRAEGHWMRTPKTGVSLTECLRRRTTEAIYTCFTNLNDAAFMQ